MFAVLWTCFDIKKGNIWDAIGYFVTLDKMDIVACGGGVQTAAINCSGSLADSIRPLQPFTVTICPVYFSIVTTESILVERSWAAIPRITNYMQSLWN
jgi:hypothetical protein